MVMTSESIVLCAISETLKRSEKYTHYEYTVTLGMHMRKRIIIHNDVYEIIKLSNYCTDSQFSFYYYKQEMQFRYYYYAISAILHFRI